MTTNLPILAITMGDPAGIGPEIAVKVFADPALYQICRPLLVGSARIMEGALSLGPRKLKINTIQQVKDARFELGTIDLLEIGLEVSNNIKSGEISAEAGNLAFHSVIRAIELAKSGEVDGTVTNPIHKKAINEAGHHFSGHTEI